MKGVERPTTFLHAFLNFADNPTKVKKYLQDKRMTRLERTVLQSMFLVRNSQSYLALELLQESTDEGFSEVISCKYYMMGVASNNLTKFQDALSFYQRARVELGSLRSEILYTICTNQFVCAYNLKQFSLCKSLYQEMTQLVNEFQKNETILLRAAFQLSLLKDDMSEAYNILEQLKLKRNCFQEGQLAAHLVDEFVFYVKNNDLKKAGLIFIEMKSIRKHMLTANYNFIKGLLSFIINGQTIYITESDYRNYPLLLAQIKCIVSLQSGDLSSARHYWDKLRLIDAKTYGENFSYNGDRCLFSLALEKFPLKECIKKDKVEINGSKEEVLMKLLNLANRPIPKDEIYEKLWGKAASSKDDYRKLAQLVYHLRKKYHIDIEQRKGSYYLDKKKAA